MRALATLLAGLLRSDDPDTPPIPGTAVVAASAPFAANGYARARLLRQCYAGGVLAPRIADTLEPAG